jgi:thiosulfate dehydrogenase
MKRALSLTFLALLVGLGLLAAQRSLAGAQGEVPGNAIIGGLIYDNWIVTLDAPLPVGNHPLWDNQDFNQRSGVITWRCVECHGWDYKGVDGAYGSYSTHYTGFRGLAGAVGASQEQVLQWLDGSLSSEHNFLTVISSTGLNDLAAFLRTQQINTDLIIDPSTGVSLGSRELGGTIYLESCASCHGDAGDEINFGTDAMPLYLGDRAVADPWQTVHKMRFGTPSVTTMLATEELGWSLSRVADVLTYIQTLPRGNPDFDILTVDPDRQVDVESQAQIEPIVWAAFAILMTVAISVGWEFYVSRKSGS